MKKLKKILLGFLIFILCVGAFAYFKADSISKKSVSAIQISDLDLSTVKDGTYVGECTSNPCAAKIKVTIENHQIKDLKLIEHKYGLGGKAESILDDVVKNQSLEVDTVSGATLSSTVILKSIENAITSEQNIK
ncbi:MAG: FMN-binding protein [Intestinibacter sp.]